jgi:hypothetical protein
MLVDSVTVVDAVCKVSACMIIQWLG